MSRRSSANYSVSYRIASRENLNDFKPFADSSHLLHFSEDAGATIPCRSNPCSAPSPQAFIGPVFSALNVQPSRPMEALIGLEPNWLLK